MSSNKRCIHQTACLSVLLAFVGQSDMRTMCTDWQGEGHEASYWGLQRLLSSPA